MTTFLWIYLITFTYINILLLSSLRCWHVIEYQQCLLLLLSSSLCCSSLIKWVLISSLKLEPAVLISILGEPTIIFERFHCQPRTTRMFWKFCLRMIFKFIFEGLKHRASDDEISIHHQWEIVFAQYFLCLHLDKGSRNLAKDQEIKQADAMIIRTFAVSLWVFAIKLCPWSLPLWAMFKNFKSSKMEWFLSFSFPRFEMTSFQSLSLWMMFMHLFSDRIENIQPKCRME